jgi:mono/diheme cytochrome c family protein
VSRLQPRQLPPAIIAAAAALTWSSVALTQEKPAAEPAAGPTTPLMIKHDYDIRQLIGLTKVPPDVYRGRVLWLQECALCHDGVGQPSYHTIGPWLDAETIKTLGEAAVRAIIADGTERMPEFRYNLQPQQVNDLIAFLNSVTYKPSADQLAGKAPGAAPSSE